MSAGVGVGVVAVGPTLPLALPPFAVFGNLVRFAAATTTRAFGGGGGLATTFALGTAVVAFLEGFATTTASFFVNFAAATSGVFVAFVAAAFVAGCLSDFGGAAGGFIGAGLRALLDGAFAVAAALFLVFVTVVSLDFFVVNL